MKLIGLISLMLLARILEAILIYFIAFYTMEVIHGLGYVNGVDSKQFGLLIALFNLAFSKYPQIQRT